MKKDEFELLYKDFNAVVYDNKVYTKNDVISAYNFIEIMHEYYLKVENVNYMIESLIEQINNDQAIKKKKGIFNNINPNIISDYRLSMSTNEIQFCLDFNYDKKPGKINRIKNLSKRFIVKYNIIKDELTYSTLNQTEAIIEKKYDGNIRGIFSEFYEYNKALNCNRLTNKVLIKDKINIDCFSIKFAYLYHGPESQFFISELKLTDEEKIIEENGPFDNHLLFLKDELKKEKETILKRLAIPVESLDPRFQIIIIDYLNNKKTKNTARQRSKK